MDNIKNIYLFKNPGGSLTVDNIIFQNVSVKNDASYVSLSQAGTAEFNSMQFYDIRPIISNDVSNTLINFKDIENSVDSNITINGLIVQNTTISILKIANNKQSTSINQYMTLNDFDIKNTSYLFTDNLIQVENVKSSAIFKIIFNRLRMADLYFEANSNLLALKHQVTEQLEINDAVFTNIRFAGILLEAFDSTLSQTSNAKISNMTAYNIDEYFR